MRKLFSKNKQTEAESIQVHKGDLEYLNQLTQAGDEARSSISGLLLTIYGAGISGLFIFVTTKSIKLNKVESWLFCLIVLTTGLIVFTALIEKLTDYFAKVQVGSQHVENIKEGKTFNATGKFNRLAPRPLTSWVLSFIPIIQLSLISINSVCVIIYIFIRVL